MTKIRILIVEDDVETRNLILRYLRDNAFMVDAASNGREMDKYLSRGGVDLIVMDLMLPEEDGLTLCRRIRESSNIPIIMLTAKGDDIDRIVGLEMGADDYVVKPFNPRELVARITAVLRRRSDPAIHSHVAGAARLTFEGWVIDRRTRELRNPEGAQVLLTSAEFDLLQAFCDQPGRVLSRSALLQMTNGGIGHTFGRSIDVLVSRLRGKLDRVEGQSMIRTVRIGGYIFAPHVEDT
jgi:two-component system OmpR family response regulator